MCVLSHVRLFVIPWTVARQAPLCMGFPWQENWSGLPFPTPGDLPDPGIKPASPALADGFFTTKPLGKLLDCLKQIEGRVSRGKKPYITILRMI